MSIFMIGVVMSQDSISFNGIKFSKNDPNAPHLTFNGIKICGSSTSFQTQMENKGYVLSKTKDGILVFNGDFIGKSTEQILVILTPKTKQVWKVVVYFNEKTSWYSLKGEFNELKDQITQKYGNPSNNYSFFSSPYDEGDGYEITGVKVEKCHFSAFWDNGISVEISKYCQVKLIYEDPFQSEIFSQEKNKVSQEGL